MKVLIIHCTYKYKGGEDTVVEEEIKLLQSKGISVKLLQFNNAGNTFLKILQLPFNLQSYYKTRRVIKSYQPDVVHIHNLHFAGSPSVIYAINKSNIPFVVTLHNYRLLCPSGMLFHKGKPFFNSIRQPFPWKAVAQGVYKNSRLLTFWVSLSMQLHHWLGTWQKAKRFIVLSGYARGVFLNSKLKLNKEQIVVKPNFYAAPAINKKPTVADFFLYAGRLSEEKGIPLLLKAFASSPYKIKIAGDGPLRSEAEKYHTQFRNIEFTGPLQKEDILSLLNNCTALIFPSIWTEGMPLIIIEAFACGTPVIASHLGVMKNMVTDGFNGLHFEAGNEYDLQKKLDLWQHFTEATRAAYRNNARKTFERYYTPEKNAEQLLSVYHSVIAKKEKAAAPAEYST